MCVYVYAPPLELYKLGEQQQQPCLLTEGLKNCPNWKPNRARQFARHNQAFGKVETSHTTTTLGGGRREQPRHQRILRI